jgi:hypothetical protein
VATLANAKVESIAQAAFRLLKAMLAEGGSIPSPEAEVALRALLEAMEAALERRLAPRFYLSSIDPGMGKSRAVIAFMLGFIRRGREPDNGILVCLATLEEVQRMVEAADIPPDSFAVLTSDEKLNALGKAVPTTAPILFTTHQMVARRRMSPEAFHFRGQSRALKVWDEGMTPTEPVVISRDKLGSLLPCRLHAPKLVELVDDLLPQLNEAKFGSSIRLESELVDAAATASSHPLIDARLRNLLRDLGSVANQRLLVVDDGGTGKAFAGIRERLPPDFAPAVILDASGRVSGVYSLWEDHRRNLVRLPSAANDYGDVEVYVWRRRNGREAYAPGSDRKELLEAIADLINEDGESQWLIFHYLFDEEFGADLRALVHTNPEGRVHTLAWGSHRATNEYRHIPNVVVTGQLTYRRSAYLASAMAASGLPARSVVELDLVPFANAEFAAHLQQAIGRSTVRQSRSGRAGAARVYVVLSPKQPPTKALDWALPGAPIGTWNERELPLRGQPAKAFNYLIERLSDGSVRKVAKSEVSRAIGIFRSSHFARITRHPALRAALEQQGIVIRHRHFERSTPERD